MPKIILFNGPPRSGKDTATKFALEYLGDRGRFYRFAEPLKDAAHALFGMSGCTTEHFDSMKGVHLPQFFGMTPREAYIWLSEEVAKPKFGKDFFTRVAVNALKNYDDHVIVISDCGFQDEVDGLIEEFGGENIFVVRIMREGTSFEGDSRSYVSNKMTRAYHITNNGLLSDLRKSVFKFIKGTVDAE
jgi:hypothetical protein